MSDYSPITRCEIVTTRVLNAPRALVFSCFTTPDHLKEWWGPKGLRNTSETCNPVTGGAWRFVMHGPDGRDYRDECRFVVVEAPEHLVIEHVSHPHFLPTITFDAFGDRTKATFRQLFDTEAIYTAVKTYAAPVNVENFDWPEAVLVRL